MPGAKPVRVNGITYKSLGALAAAYGINPHTVSNNRKRYPNDPEKWVKIHKVVRLDMPEIGARTGRLTFIEELEPKITKHGNRTHTDRRLKLKCDCGEFTYISLAQWGKSWGCKKCGTSRAARSREIENTRMMLNKPLNENSYLIVRARDWKKSGYVLCECTAPGCTNNELTSVSKTTRERQLSCGCLLLRKGLEHPSSINLINEVFGDGKVKVVKFIRKTDDDDDFIWEALCTAGGKNCEGVFKVRGRSLTSGKQVSCGCIQRQNAGLKKRKESPVQLNTPLTGSYLIPREEAGHNDHNQLLWKCECTYNGPGCTGWWTGTTGQLSTRNAKSCGCLNEENLKWGGIRLKRCYEDEAFANKPRYFYIAHYDKLYWKFGITHDPEERGASPFYQGFEYTTKLTTTGIAMAIERALLNRTRWAAPDPIPLKYYMKGGTEIRYKSDIDLYTAIRLTEDLFTEAERIGWKQLVQNECPFPTNMEPVRYTEY